MTPSSCFYSCLRQEMCRQDDLWSLFYMLVEFIVGQLPWRKMKDKDQIGTMKDTYDYFQLLNCLPAQFQTFFNHIRGLDYYDQPDYNLLRGLMYQCMLSRGVRDTDPFDWERTTGAAEYLIGATTAVVTQTKPFVDASRFVECTLVKIVQWNRQDKLERGAYYQNAEKLTFHAYCVQQFCV